MGLYILQDVIHTIKIISLYSYYLFIKYLTRPAPDTGVEYLIIITRKTFQTSFYAIECFQ